MIRNSAWAVILLLLAVAASPLPGYGLPAGAVAMPVHGGSGPAAATTSCCSCTLPAKTTTATPPVTTSPRQAGGTDTVPGTGSAAPALPGSATVPCRFSGIRRIFPKNVLDHPERAAVYAWIVEQPGIDISAIASALGMHRETLRYHLGMLESAMKIIVLRDRGIVRYYENHGRYTLLERKVLRHLRNPTGKAMLFVIAARPGITQSGIAEHFGITAPTVRWYIHRFRADGIVTEQREGKYTRYSLSPEVGGFVSSTGADVPVAAPVG